MDVLTTGAKTCSKCGSTKSSEDFYRNKSRPDGLSHWCKVCFRAYYNQHHERVKAGVLARRANNPDAYREYMSRWHGQNREYERNKQLKRNYGITAEEYDALLDKQSGVCAACGEPEVTKSRWKGDIRMLCVDHDHKTGKVRGLLCGRCNAALGHLRDDAKYVRMLLAYAEAF